MDIAFPRLRFVWAAALTGLLLTSACNNSTNTPPPNNGGGTKVPDDDGGGEDASNATWQRVALGQGVSVELPGSPEQSVDENGDLSWGVRYNGIAYIVGAATVPADTPRDEMRRLTAAFFQGCKGELEETEEKANGRVQVGFGRCVGKKTIVLFALTRGRLFTFSLAMVTPNLPGQRTEIRHMMDSITLE